MLSAPINATLSAVPYLYAYDGIGNRASSSTNGVFTAYAANALNKYTAVGNAEPTHDISSNWGPDLSGPLQGAGGVGGLVAVSANGAGRPSSSRQVALLFRRGDENSEDAVCQA